MAAGLPKDDMVEPLSPNDRVWLDSMEKSALQQVREYTGEDLLFQRTEADLKQLQLLLDFVVYDTESDDLYTFGVVLGNVFDARTTMKWAVVTNEYGRNVAIHDPAIGFTLYPVQMISNRVEDGREVNVVNLYRSFVNDLNIGL